MDPSLKQALGLPFIALSNAVAKSLKNLKSREYDALARDCELFGPP